MSEEIKLEFVQFTSNKVQFVKTSLIGLDVLNLVYKNRANLSEEFNKKLFDLKRRVREIYLLVDGKAVQFHKFKTLQQHGLKDGNTISIEFGINPEFQNFSLTPVNQSLAQSESSLFTKIVKLEGNPPTLEGNGFLESRWKYMLNTIRQLDLEISDFNQDIKNYLDPNKQASKEFKKLITHLKKLMLFFDFDTDYDFSSEFGVNPLYIFRGANYQDTLITNYVTYTCTVQKNFNQADFIIQMIELGILPKPVTIKGKKSADLEIYFVLIFPPFYSATEMKKILIGLEQAEPFYTTLVYRTNLISVSDMEFDIFGIYEPRDIIPKDQEGRLKFQEQTIKNVSNEVFTNFREGAAVIERELRHDPVTFGDISQYKDSTTLLWRYMLRKSGFSIYLTRPTTSLKILKRQFKEEDAKQLHLSFINMIYGVAKSYLKNIISNNYQKVATKPRVQKSEEKPNYAAANIRFIRQYSQDMPGYDTPQAFGGILGGENFNTFPVLKLVSYPKTISTLIEFPTQPNFNRDAKKYAPKEELQAYEAKDFKLEKLACFTGLEQACINSDVNTSLYFFPGDEVVRPTTVMRQAEINVDKIVSNLQGAKIQPQKLSDITSIKDKEERERKFKQLKQTYQKLDVEDYTRKDLLKIINDNKIIIENNLDVMSNEQLAEEIRSWASE